MIKKRLYILSKQEDHRPVGPPGLTNWTKEKLKVDSEWRYLWELREYDNHYYPNEIILIEVYNGKAVA